MKLDIVRRQFAKINNKWIEIEDLRRQSLAVERTWSSFCVLIPTDKTEAFTATLRTQVPQSHVDLVPSPAAGGTWLMGPYYQLQDLLVRSELR